MEICVKGLALLFLFFLVMPNIGLAKKQCPCMMKGMKGELPENVCLMTEFIKKLPKYDPKKIVAHMTNNYIFSGKPGTGKTRCIELIEKETGAIVLRYDLSSFYENHMGIDEVYKKAEAIVEREKRPVILVFENIDQGMATGGGLLHGVTQDHSENMYIWTIAVAHDHSKITAGLQNRCHSARFKLPNREVRKETIQEEAERHEVNLPWLLLHFSSALSCGKSVGDIEQTFKNISDQSKDGQFNAINLVHELSKHNYVAAGIASITSIATAYALIYGIRSGKIYSLIQKLFSQKSKPKPELSTENKKK